MLSGLQLSFGVRVQFEAEKFLRCSQLSVIVFQKIYADMTNRPIIWVNWTVWTEALSLLFYPYLYCLF